jgi:hypothetical protein
LHRQQAGIPLEQPCPGIFVMAHYVFNELFFPGISLPETSFLYEFSVAIQQVCIQALLGCTKLQYPVMQQQQWFQHIFF